MPHKRNPVVSERVCGLARVIRGSAQVALENMVLWHERDISHSSAERMIFPDATGLLAFMLRDLTWVLDGLIVFPDRMRENLENGGGLVYSQAVLLELVGAGLSRDEAYLLVQSAAASAWDEGTSFREVLEADPEVGRRLGPATLDSLFDPRRSLMNLGGVFDKLEKLPVEVERDALAAAARSREGPRRLRRRRGPAAARRHRPHQRLRRRAARPDPRQGPGAHGPVVVLVRSHGRPGSPPRRVDGPVRTSRRRSPACPRSSVARRSSARRRSCRWSVSPAGTSPARDGRSTERPGPCAACRFPTGSSSPTASPSRSSRRPAKRTRATTCRSLPRRGSTSSARVCSNG